MKKKSLFPYLKYIVLPHGILNLKIVMLGCCSPSSFYPENGQRTRPQSHPYQGQKQFEQVCIRCPASGPLSELASYLMSVGIQFAT